MNIPCPDCPDYGGVGDCPTCDDTGTIPDRRDTWCEDMSLAPHTVEHKRLIFRFDVPYTSGICVDFVHWEFGGYFATNREGNPIEDQYAIAWMLIPPYRKETP